MVDTFNGRIYLNKTPFRMLFFYLLPTLSNFFHKIAYHLDDVSDSHSWNIYLSLL